LAGKKNSEEESVGYYAVIPAFVRYDKSLPQGAKLLYGEISALIKKKGFCWSRNPYFAGLYDTSERTIIEWIWRLHAAGHVDIYFDYFPDSKKIAHRYIALPYPAGKELPKELAEAHFVERKSSPPEGLVVKKSSLLEDLVVKETSPLIVKETSPPEDLVVKKTSPPSGEENSLVIYTNSNNTSSSSDLPETLPEEEEHNFHSKKKNNSLNILSLKSFFKQLDGSLIFSSDFYPKAISFLADNNLDLEYVRWIYKFCLEKRPKNIDNYLFKVFFDSRLVDLFLENFKPPSVSLISCPVCSTEHDSGLSECPVCGLNSSGRHNQEQINLKKRFFNLPSNLKDAYEQEFNSLHESTKHLDFRERRILLENLDRKYGLIS
jgi:hypothetical protein